MRRWGASGRSRARMKRVLRDVVLGAVSCVATVGAGSGVVMAAATDALAQDATTTPAPTSPTSQAPTTQTQTQAQTPAQTPAPQARTTAPSRTRAPAQRPAAGQRQTAAPTQTALAPIQRIVVQGNQRIEPATVISYLLIHPGDTFDPE